MKKILMCMLAALMCLATVSCASSPVYSDSVSVEYLADAALEAVGSAQDYMDGTSSYYVYYFEGKDGAEHIGECRMMFHTQETNVNELGIFRADSTKNVEAVKALVQSYLVEQQDYLCGFAKNYSPEDMNKIDNADVAVIGCYVVYYILSPEHEAVALETLRSALTVE